MPAIATGQSLLIGLIRLNHFLRRPKRINRRRHPCIHRAMQQRFADLGAFIRPTTPDEFGRYLNSEIAKWGDIVRSSGATVE